VRNYTPATSCSSSGSVAVRTRPVAQSDSSATARSCCHSTRDGSATLTACTEARQGGYWSRESDSAKFPRAVLPSRPGPHPIRFIGVWDTVGALGIPLSGLRLVNVLNRRWQFHDTQLSSTVQSAFHALAIDEKRGSFEPAVWKPSSAAAGQQREQVWFAGDHCDVGGGHGERDCRCGASMDRRVRTILRSRDRTGCVCQSDTQLAWEVAHNTYPIPGARHPRPAERPDTPNSAWARVRRLGMPKCLAGAASRRVRSCRQEVADHKVRLLRPEDRPRTPADRADDVMTGQYLWPDRRGSF